MKTNQKGFWAVASAPIISSVVARFSVLLLSCLLWSSVGWGQTNPVPFDLSTSSFSFTTQTATNTTYPTNIQGWSTSTNNIASAETSIPSADQTLVASGTASTSGLSNLGSNGFQFLSTSTSPNRKVGSIAISLNTTGRQSITLSWTAQDMTSSATGTSMGLSLQYRVGTSGIFTDFGSSGLYSTSSSSQTAAQNYTNIVLPAACENQSIVQIRWIYYQIGTTGTARDAIRLDDITISSTAIPACSGTPSPGNTLATVNPVPSGSSTSLSLQNTTSGTGVTYQWQSSANNSSWSNIVGATSVTYSATPSTATYYRCNVTCSGNTATSGSLLVSLTYCSSTGPSTQGSDYFTNFTTTNGIGNVNNSTTYSTNGYGDYTAQVVSQYTGGAVSYSLTSPGVSNGSSFGIFIDWNQDFDFADAGESVYNSNGNVSVSPSGSFSVPSGAAIGSTRMRIIVQDATAAVISCNNAQSASETEDYTFTVVQLPACAAPTSLASTASSTAQSNTTISASFTAANSAPTAYLVVRTNVNTQPVPVTGTTYTTGSNAIGFIEYVGSSAGSWTSTSLTPGTIYYYWVFSYNNTNCTGGPVYSASATSFSQATISCTGAALANLTYTSATNTYCTGTAISTNVAALGTSSGTPQYTVSPSLPTGLAISSSTGNITGTPTTAQTSTAYTVTADNGCTSTTATVNIEIVTSPTAPTSGAVSLSTYSGFTANWTTNGASSYQLDVAKDASFTNLVTGYNALNVGNTSTYAVTGLNAGATYYYRVRSVNGSCVSANSTSQTATTTAITSVASGNWNATTTWNSGTVPVCGDVVNIANTHNVTVNSSSNVSGAITIASGGTLTIASGDLTVGCTLNNTPLTNNGTLTVTGGTLNVNGNIVIASGATFNQSGGEITIDGNAAGVAASSVPTGTNLLRINSNLLNLTGGRITIVDPHAGSSTSDYAIGYSTSSLHYACGTGHTTRFGNGVSTDPGGHTNGFYNYLWVSSGYLSLGNVEIDALTGTNRFVKSTSTIGIMGNLNIISGEYQLASTTYIAGNISNGGILTNTSTLILGTWSNATGSATSNAQTISGLGTFRNATTSSTASMSSLTINNSNTTGVTLSVPLSISGTLTMTAGKINTTTTNLLTLGTSIAAGTLVYTAGQIAGPFARTFAASRTASGTYTVATLFPVGDGSTYLPVHIDPTTTSAGAVVMRGQAFNTNSGTGGNGVASTLSNDRWDALVTSGSANLTNCFIGLNDAQVATGNIIAQSASASGIYNSITPASTVASGVSIRTATAIAAADYTGYFTFAAPGPKITAFTPTNACPNAVTTITITGTGLGSATSVTLNGEACTITNNTATSITVITDATPQAGNIIVTTAANSATSATAMSLYTLPTVTASSNVANNTVCSGTSVTLNGAGANTYSWNNSVSNNVAFTPSSSTTYTVTGTDAYGCTNTASLAITVNQIVAITAQPSNQVVLPNANATFSVTASGTGLAYQWEENSGSGWSAITNGGIYSGATTSSLTLTGVSSQNNNQYRVVISGTAPCSALTSNAATLTISTTAISAHPQNQTICTSSGTASFSITTTGTTPTYQWQVSTNSGTTWTDISGETNASLSLTGLVLANSTNQYRCSLNSGAVLSNAAILTVYDPPVITQQPSNLTVCANATSGAFSVTATGSNLTYQWQRSIDAGTTWSNITGATTNTLSFTSYTNSMDGYQYKVIISGSSPCSAATSNVVTLNVTGIVSVAASSSTTCTNSAITLTATPTASASGLSYSWSSTTGSGASTPLTTNPASVTPTTAGTYTYTLATTGGSCSFSNTLGLTVNPSPSTLTLSPSAATNVCAGNIQSIVASGGMINNNSVVTLGTATTLTSATSQPTAFCNRWKHYWMQTVYTAAELNALGIQAGNITGIRFNTNAQGSANTVTDFKIRISTTSNSTLSAFITSNLNLVYSIATYNVSVGLNTIMFDNPYNWDGTSNLIIDVRQTGADATNNSTTYYTATSGNTVLHASTSTVSTSDGFAATNPTPTTSVNRLNIGFFANVPIQQTITWSPTTDLYTNAAATTAYTGNPSTVYSKPTANRTYTATATTSNGCTSSASVTLNYVPTNTVSAASATPTLCINTALTSITHTTTGATGIGTATGLPAGVSAAWATNTITISGTPTASGTFNYSIPLTGGCGSVNATGTITVTANNTVAVASSTPSLCINSILTNITHTTTGATGIGTASGLPAGVSAAWANNTITISGTPTAAGTFAYTIPLSGGCGSVNATGTITVNVNTASAPSATPTLCANTALTAITHTTTGATGISGAGVSGANTLPAGVSATWANNTITISGTPTAPGTFNYSIPLTGGCANVFATGTITVNQTNPPTGSSNQTLCTNATVADLNATGTNIQWFAAATGGSALAGTTALANGSHYFAEQTANACASPTRLDVTVQLQNQWSGSSSSDWSVGSNWSCGVVPNATDDALIPSTGITNLPNLSVNAGIKNISVGSTVILNGKTLTINGAISGTAAITGSANSGLVIAGAAGAINMTNTNTTDNVLNMLTINNGASATVGSNGIKMAPGGTVTVNGTLTLTGNLRLQSDATATARVAQSTGTITGALTQERYVPGKAIRKWSFLASPVTQSLASAWQQQIHITGAGTGGTMCNNYTISGTMTPHTNGFDVTQLQNPSFYTYDAATDNFVANTTGTTNYTLTPGVGYMVLVRGDRNDASNGGCVLLSANNQAAFTSTPVTLAATGAVGQGTITKVLPAGYSFIGNPYPCEIDFPSFNTTNASVISGGYWTYYPTNATYTFSTYNNGTSTNGGTQVIANGQSFLVNSTSGGTITFNEAHKSTTANNGNFRLTKTWDELIRVGLSNNQGNRLDEVVVRFGNDAAITKALNEYDAASVNGGDQWIKTLKETSELAIQTRPNTYQNDTVSLAMHAKNAGIYQLNFSEYQGLSNTEVYLIDQQENLIQNVKALPSYQFSVGANTTTANRFKLIFDAKTSGVAALATKAALQVYPNPTKDKVRITCDGLAYGVYQIKVRTITGAEVLKAKGTYYQNEVIELSVQDLAAGMYMLELTQDNGLRAIQKITKQ